jgi:hypothetical protein
LVHVNGRQTLRTNGKHAACADDGADVAIDSLGGRRTTTRQGIKQVSAAAPSAVRAIVTRPLAAPPGRQAP